MNQLTNTVRMIPRLIIAAWMVKRLRIALLCLILGVYFVFNFMDSYRHLSKVLDSELRSHLRMCLWSFVGCIGTLMSMLEVIKRKDAGQENSSGE